MGSSRSTSISGASVLPFGDALKLLKAKKHAKTINNIIEVVTYAGQKVDPKTGQKLGGSGKARSINVKHSSNKKAKDAARQGGKGTPVSIQKIKKEEIIIIAVMGKKERAKGPKTMEAILEKRTITYITSIPIMDNKEIAVWFGLVEVKPINNNNSLEGAEGAYVNVAYIAESRIDFLQKIKDSFKENDFKVDEIDDVETINSLNIDNPDNSEKLELLNDIEAEGFEFSWGVFHTYDKE